MAPTTASIAGLVRVLKYAPKVVKWGATGLTVGEILDALSDPGLSAVEVAERVAVGVAKLIDKRGKTGDKFDQGVTINQGVTAGASEEVIAARIKDLPPNVIRGLFLVFLDP